MLKWELVRTVTSDGLRLDGAYAGGSPSHDSLAGAATALTSAADPQSRLAADVVLCLPGVASNFYGSQLLRQLAETLVHAGVAVLCVNTRGHDNVFTASTPAGPRRFGAAYEIVDECRQDIAAWLKYLDERGLTRVVLAGHSLGAIKALYSQAHAPSPAVAGVIAMSPPRLSYSMFELSGHGPSFVDTMRDAQHRIAAGRGNELLEIQFPFPLLITASAYVDKYGPAERYNILQFAGQVTCPLLATYGAREVADGNPAFQGLPEALSDLCGDTAEVALIPDADHLYTGCQQPLSEVLVRWLGKLGG